MKVILQKNIEKVGHAGDIIKVKDGYARNFLLPKGLAVEANEANLRIVDKLKESRNVMFEKEKTQAKTLADKLQAASFTLAVEANVDDKLYGSVSSVELASFLESEGYKIDKKDILLEEPIKSLGIYEVKVKLYPEVDTQIKVWIVKK